MRYSATIARLENEGSRAWDIHVRAQEERRRGRDVILLSIGDPDFPTPPGIVDALVESVTQGNTHYGDVDGARELRCAIADRHARETGTDVGWENVTVTPGAQGALFGAIMCLAQPGDEVVVPQPCYVTYDSVVQASGATLVSVPLRPERSFHLDADDVAAAITPRTRAIMINTPHNPTGAALGRDELEGLAHLCRVHDLWLVSDEVYSRTLFDGRRHVSPWSLPDMASRCVVIGSLSKSHAMTGWRVGWTVAPAAFARHMYNLALAIHYGLPSFIQAAAVEAVRGDYHEVGEMTRRYQTRLDLMCDCLASCGNLAVVRPQGACFMMIDVRATGLSSMDFSWRLLEEAGVAVLACESFGSAGAGFVRLSLTASDDDLRVAGARIAGFAATLPGR